MKKSTAQNLTPDKVTADISSATAADRDMSDTQVA